MGNLIIIIIIGPGYAHPYRRGRYDGNLPDDAPVQPRIWYGIHSFHYGTIFRIIMIMAAKRWANGVPRCGILVTNGVAAVI